MARTVRPIPAGYHTVTPYLSLRNAAQAIEFYKKAFGATELFRMEHQGRIGHAELQIGDSRVMLADEYPEMGMKGPETLGGAAVSILLYVEDCDRVAEQAVRAGAKTLRPLANQFYGDRNGTFQDPFGHSWTIATHVEDVSPEEMGRRAQAAFGG